MAWIRKTIKKPCECGSYTFKVKDKHKRYYGEKDKGWMMDLYMCENCGKIYKENYVEFEDIKFKKNGLYKYNQKGVKEAHESK